MRPRSPSRPDSDGGDPITSFAAQCVSTDGGVVQNKAGAASPITVTHSYARQELPLPGHGPPTASAQGPTAPTGARSPRPRCPRSADCHEPTTPQGGAVRVAFSPGSANGSPITSFAAHCVSTDGGVTKTENGCRQPDHGRQLEHREELPLPRTGHQRDRHRPYSPYGATVLVQATAPGAPTVTGTTRGAGQAITTFTPGSHGGSPITGFSAQCVRPTAGDPKRHGTTSPITVSATSGKNYHCRVRPPTPSVPVLTAPTEPPCQSADRHDVLGA